MAFEQYVNRYGRGRHVTLGKDAHICITAQLMRELDQNSRYATYYFDSETNHVAIHITEHRQKHYALKVSGYIHKDRKHQSQTVTLAGVAFLKFHSIKYPQYHIPATIEEIDGKRMIVFPVEVEASDG